MIVFLEEYFNCSSIEIRESLEDYFSYAVCDFLDNKKDSKEYDNLKIKYNKTIEIAEEVARDKDLELDNANNKVNKLIKKIINENNLEFMKELFPYLIRYNYLAKLYRRS